MFSKACRYAIRSTLFLASRSSKDSRISVEEMATTLTIPRHFLAKVLQKLSKSDLVSSIKGPGGGFFLSQSNKESSLYEIIKCIDGEEVMEGCILGKSECSNKNPCALHFQAIAYREGLFYQLNNLSIKELAQKL